MSYLVVPRGRASVLIISRSASKISLENGWVVSNGATLAAISCSKEGRIFQRIAGLESHLHSRLRRTERSVSFLPCTTMQTRSLPAFSWDGNWVSGVRGTGKRMMDAKTRIFGTEERGGDKDEGWLLVGTKWPEISLPLETNFYLFRCSSPACHFLSDIRAIFLP